MGSVTSGARWNSSGPFVATPGPVKSLRRRTSWRAERAQLRGDAALSVLVLLSVWLISIATVLAADHQGVLTGEEASVSFADVVALSERFQLSHYSTNFGGHVFYWVASKLDPFFDLYYARWWKAAAMGGLAPLVFLTLRRRLGCARAAAALGALAACLLPGVTAFSWLATENGLEAVAGMWGLYMATSRRPVWWMAPALAAVSISLYGAGLAWASAIVAVSLWRLAHSRRRLRSLVRVAAATVLGVGFVVFPLWWWHGGTIVTGGGNRGVSPDPQALVQLAGELFSSGNSYYYFNSQPALGPSALAVVSAAALLWCAVRRRRVWPWLTVLIATVILYAMSGGVLGVRRAISISVVAGMGIGLAADMVMKSSVWKAVAKSAATRPAARQSVVVSATAVMAALILMPLAIALDDYRAALYAGMGQHRLPVGFPFPIASGETMLSTLHKVAQQRRDGVPWSVIATEREGARTASMLLLLQEHDKVAPGIVTGGIVYTLYRQGRTCDEECEPTADRK